MRFTELQIALVTLQYTVASGIRSGNRALNKPANQSSVHSRLQKAEKAVDGIADDFSYRRSCSYTAPGHGSSWWQVDLEEQVNIQEIRVLNGRVFDFNMGVLVERIHDVSVDVFETVTLPRMRKPCTTYKVPSKGGWVNLTCDDPVSGRVVGLSKGSLTPYDVLVLCEVEVYGPNDGAGASILTREEPSHLSYRNCCSICG